MVNMEQKNDEELYINFHLYHSSVPTLTTGKYGTEE